jgi:hypothetical protein
MKHGKSDTGRRNSSVKDKKPAGYKDKDPTEDTARDTITALATMKGLTKRNKSPKVPTRSEDKKGVDDTDQRRKDSSRKPTLFASQTKEAPESLHYPESRRSTSENSVIQKETELSEKRTEPITSDDTMEQPMAKGCIETINIDNDDKRMLDLGMRLGYFGLRLHDQMEIPETDKLLKIVDQIEERSARVLLDTGCNTYVLSSSFAERNGIPGIKMRPRPVDLAISNARAQLTHKTALLQFRIEKTVIIKSLYFLFHNLMLLLGCPFSDNKRSISQDWK